MKNPRFELLTVIDPLLWMVITCSSFLCLLPQVNANGISCLLLIVIFLKILHRQQRHAMEASDKLLQKSSKPLHSISARVYMMKMMVNEMALKKREKKFGQLIYGRVKPGDMICFVLTMIRTEFQQFQVKVQS